MRFARRTFLKGTGAVAGTTAVGYYGLDRIVPGARTPERRDDGPEPAPAYTEQWIPTTCWIGKQDCGLLARVVNGRVVKFEGNPAHPKNLGTTCPKGMAQIQAIYDPHRLKTPLIRTNAKGVTGEWRRATWDEALTLVADKLTAARAKDPKFVVWQKGRSKSEAFYDGAFLNSITAPSAPTPAIAPWNTPTASRACCIPTSATRNICSPSAGT